MSILKHAHKLKRHKFKNKEAVYFCVLDDCDYRSSTKLTLGKKAICWRCNKEFRMNEASMRLDKPHCLDCTHKKDWNSSFNLDRLVNQVPDEIQVRVAIKEKPADINNLRADFDKLLQGVDVGVDSNASSDTDEDII